MALHLMKLCIGVRNMDDMKAWQSRQMQQVKHPYHRTLNIPKRADELLDGGSLYWVVGNKFLVRQKFIDIKQGINADGKSFCEMILDKNLVPLIPQSKSPFHGWRYLAAENAPLDLETGLSKIGIPARLEFRLKEALVW